MCPRLFRTESAAILLLCWCTTVVGEAAAIDPPRQRNRRLRHVQHHQQQQQIMEPIHRPLLPSPTTTTEDENELQQQQRHPAAANTAPSDSDTGVDRRAEDDSYRPPIFESNTVSSQTEVRQQPSPTPSPLPQEKEGAIIRGMVYNDLNQNGQQDTVSTNNNTNEPGVPSVVVKLFSCSTGSRVSITRTNDLGQYTFAIPPTALPNPATSNSSECYYIQYNVNNYIVPNAFFITPQNGETADIHLRAGEEIGGVDAGMVVGATPTVHPTYYEWATWSPTGVMNVGTPATATAPIAAPSPAPMSITMSPITEGPTVPTETGLLPLPAGEFETVVVDSPSPVAVAYPTYPTSAVVTLALPTDTVVISTQAPMMVSSKAPSSAPSTSPVIIAIATEEEPDDEKKPGGGKQELPNNDILAKPSEKEPSTGKDAEKEKSSEGILSLKTTVRIQLDNLPSTMDSNAQLIFENVCTEFLNDQLQYATPPILNVECGLVGQLLVESRRSRRNLSRNLRGFDTIDDSSRALASSSSLLTADVQVTGEVEKTPSVQETADVQFQKLLVGTFNVQGYLFAESLKEEEEEDDNETTSTSSTYYQSIGGVRGINADGANAQESSEGEGGDAVLFTKGVIAAIVVGGVIVLMLLLLIVMKARKRRQSSESRSHQSKAVVGTAASSTSKTNTKSSSSSTAKKTAASAKSPPPLPTSPTMSSTSSPRSSTAAASPKSSSSHRRSRLRREIMAPSGKLGIMVANTTKPGHGPAVHTIRPGSPMEGLVYVNDIIVGVNDVDTRKFTAEEITQVMKDTAGEGRKIIVLSAHR